MFNFSLSNSSFVATGPGGIFDINATLPLVVLQFLALVVLLNFTLYGPLSLIMDERDNYILKNFEEAAGTLTEVKTLTDQYEQRLKKIHGEAHSEVVNSQRIYTTILNMELTVSQDSIDTLLCTIQNELLSKKKIISKNLTKTSKELAYFIENKLAF